MSKHFTIEPHELIRLRNWLKENRGKWHVGGLETQLTEFSDMQLRTWAELYIPRIELEEIIGRNKTPVS